MKIIVDLQPILSTPLTYLRSAITAGSSVSTDVLNTSGFAANDYVIVGRLGEERSEIKYITSITDIDTLVLNSLSFGHSNNTIVQKVLYDQVKIERSADGVSYSVIATITLTGDQSHIEYIDTSGTSSSYYKVRFYNSTSAVHSSYTSSSQSSNPAVNDTLIQDIKILLNEEDNDIDTSRILNALATVDMKIARVIARLNPDYFKSYSSINLVQGTQEYALPENMVRATQVLLKLTSTDELSESSAVPQSYGNGTEDYGNSKVHYFYQNSADKLIYIGLKANVTESVTDGIKVYYVKRPTRITSITDTLNTPHPTMFYDIIRAGVLSELFKYDKDRQDLAKACEEEYQVGLMDIINLVNANDDSEHVEEYSAALMDIFDGGE